jgi:uncharacterized alpha-E superfamily protein
MNRYIERAENVSRFVDVNLHLMLDMPSGADEQWEAVLSASGDFQLFQERFGEATRENVVKFLTFDTNNPNSIYSCVTAARENARTVREVITAEMWEQINTFYLTIRAAANVGAVPGEPHEFFTGIKMAGHLYEGITDATMSHGEGWHFGRLGRLLERANMTSRILDVMYFHLLPGVEDVGGPVDDVRWSAVLRSRSAFEMYRQRYGPIAPDRVAEFMILDTEFPRSMNSCIINSDESLHAISGTPVGAEHNQAEETLYQLRSDLNQAKIDEIIIGGLHEFLEKFRSDINLVGQSIYNTYFALPVVDAALGEIPVETQ